MNRNNHPNSPYSDLTIYDRGLDRDSENSLSWVKCVYATTVVANSILIGLMMLGALYTFDIISIAY